MEAAQPPDLPSGRLLKVSLTNYLAAAVMMPYRAFHDAAERGYDIGLLAARFGVRFEQACHRLTTLSRPASVACHSFCCGLTSAGNISKRFAIAFPFARFGGACPRWNIHERLPHAGPGHDPDESRRRTARAISPWPARCERPCWPLQRPEDAELAIGLGCEVKYADKLVYSP